MIKMVALHCVMSNPNAEYWQEKHLVERNQELRDRLQDSLVNYMLTDIFLTTLNLMNCIKVSKVKTDVVRYLDNSHGPTQ